MKKIFLALFTITLLMFGVVFTYSQDQGTTPTAPNKADCKLDDINAALDNAIAAIKASPAIGHAGGHYKKAVADLERTKKQLAIGCNQWVKGGEKTGKRGKK